MLGQMYMGLLKEVIYLGGKNNLLFKLRDVCIIFSCSSQQIIGCTV